MAQNDRTKPTPGVTLNPVHGGVIEIPTPRWTAWDQKHFGTKLPMEIPMITQERADDSPIWYTP